MKMASSSYTSHIKASHLKSLIEADGDCQSKLSQISQLVGVPPPVADTEASTASASESDPQLNEAEIAERQKLERRDESYRKILDGLSGKSEKLARGLLQRIETAENLSFDYGTLEISINGIKKTNSSIRSLVHRMITVSSPQLPICLAEFINGLIDNRVPLNYFQNSDCLQLRLSLLSLKKNQQLNDISGNTVSNIEGSEGTPATPATPDTPATPATPTVGEQEVTGVSNEANAGASSVESRSSLKRGREEDQEEENLENNSKKVRFDDSVANFDGKINRKKRAREVDEEDVTEKKQEKKRKKSAPKKVRTPGTRKSSRLQLKDDLATDWVS